MIEVPVETRSIRAHYDNLSRFYRAFWGDHIHHGYWDGATTPVEAQIRLIAQLASFAGVEQGARVLDVGCGVGGSSVWLAENFGCSVLGLTISPVQSEMGSRLAERKGVGARVSFQVHDANQLDQVPDGFDVVWAIESTEHLQDKRAFVKSAAGRLRPGGTLAFCVWLVPDSFASAEHQELARRVCQDMLCPSLASMREYQHWMEEVRFREVRFRDLTRKVERTWDHCARIARRPEVQLILHAMDNQTRRFVGAFDAMRRAYTEGAMRYGMFAGRIA